MTLLCWLKPALNCRPVCVPGASSLPPQTPQWNNPLISFPVLIWTWNSVLSNLNSPPSPQVLDSLLCLSWLPCSFLCSSSIVIIIMLTYPFFFLYLTLFLVEEIGICQSSGSCPLWKNPELGRSPFCHSPIWTNYIGLYNNRPRKHRYAAQRNNNYGGYV